MVYSTFSQNSSATLGHPIFAYTPKISGKIFSEARILKGLSCLVLPTSSIPFPMCSGECMSDF